MIVSACGCCQHRTPTPATSHWPHEYHEAGSPDQASYCPPLSAEDLGLFGLETNEIVDLLRSRLYVTAPIAGMMCFRKMLTGKLSGVIRCDSQVCVTQGAPFEKDVTPHAPRKSSRQSVKDSWKFHCTRAWQEASSPCYNLHLFIFL